MKYRTKIYISFFLISFVSSIIAICFVFFESKKILISNYQHELEAVVAATASFLDGEEIKNISNEYKDHIDLYHQHQKKLIELQKKIIDSGLPIAHFYTVHKKAEAPGELFFGLNTALDPHQILPPGIAYLASNKDELLKYFGIPFTSSVPYFGAFGRWFSAFVPIRGKNNQVVAMLGIDVSAQAYYQEINHLFTSHMIALSISLIASLILAFFFSRRVTRSVSLLMKTATMITHGHFDVPFTKKMDQEFATLAEEMSNIGQSLSYRSKIEANFASYVSYPVLQSILRSPPPLTGETKYITALYGVLNVPSTSDTTHVIELLNTLFESMIDINFKHKGTVQNIGGDGFLLIFGAPLEDPYQEKHSLSAAIEILEVWDNIKKVKAEGLSETALNIGIHSGEALVGDIGKEDNLHYTAVGPTIEIAGEIAKEAKKMKIPLLFSGRVKEEQTPVTEIGKLGDKPVSLYTLS